MRNESVREKRCHCFQSLIFDISVQRCVYEVKLLATFSIASTWAKSEYATEKEN